MAEALDLQPHPEGGWFRQTFASPETVTTTDGRTRGAATLILFALGAGESSAWHVVASDEVWIANVGTVTLELGGTGEQPAPSAPAERVVLGTDVGSGQLPQALVPAGTWQRTVPADADALVSCLVSPGFDFADFRLAG
ncbi:UNVERIFIED_CONTAM: cupin [Mumia flava]